MHNANLISLSVCHLAENDDDEFDLIEPSLIQQLRKILDQYPDDNQILKASGGSNKRHLRPYKLYISWCYKPLK